MLTYGELISGCEEAYEACGANPQIEFDRYLLEKVAFFINSAIDRGLDEDGSDLPHGVTVPASTPVTKNMANDMESRLDLMLREYVLTSVFQDLLAEESSGERTLFDHIRGLYNMELETEMVKNQMRWACNRGIDHQGILYRVLQQAISADDPWGALLKEMEVVLTEKNRPIQESMEDEIPERLQCFVKKFRAFLARVPGRVQAAVGPQNLVRIHSAAH